MENRVPALDGERVFWGSKKAKDHLRDCEIKVLSYWTVEMDNRSEMSFMVSTRHLYIGDTDISHLCHNALCIRVDQLSTEPHEPMNERIKGASHDKRKSHGAYLFNCI